MTQDKFGNILKGALKEIKPTDKKLLADIDAFLAKINAEIKKKKVNARAVVGGSISKDTHLKGDHDCDVFLRFHYSYKNEDLSKLLEKVLKPFKPELVHGSRDYYHIKNKINYEFVPVLDIDDPKKAVNVTDMSPLHTAWVSKHPGLNDEIRLAKQFCKSARVYGAESYIKGFSGHVLDILTIHYGGFVKLLRASQKWKEKEVIDPEGYYKGKKALVELNRSKIDSPIIVIDPVSSNRNAAAALSQEKLEKFQIAAKQFLKTPSPDAFKVRVKTIEDIKKDAGNKKLIVLEADSLEGKEDIIGAKLMKAFQLVRNQLKFHDFTIISADWNWDKKKKALFWYVLDPKDLFPVAKWVGPPLKEKERVESFKEKHKETFEESGRVCTYVKRKYTVADKLIKNVLKDPLILEKVKKIIMKRVR